MPSCNIVPFNDREITGVQPCIRDRILQLTSPDSNQVTTRCDPHLPHIVEYCTVDNNTDLSLSVVVDISLNNQTFDSGDGIQQCAGDVSCTSLGFNQETHGLLRLASPESNQVTYDLCLPHLVVSGLQTSPSDLLLDSPVIQRITSSPIPDLNQKSINVDGVQHVINNPDDIIVYAEEDLITDQKNTYIFIILMVLLRIPFIICDAFYSSKSNACVLQHPWKRGTKLDINMRSYLLVSSIYSMIILIISIYISIINNINLTWTPSSHSPFRSPTLQRATSSHAHGCKHINNIEVFNKFFRIFWLFVGFIGYFYNLDNIKCENTFNIYMFVSISMKTFIEICTPDFFNKKYKYFF